MHTTHDYEARSGLSSHTLMPVNFPKAADTAAVMMMRMTTTMRSKKKGRGRGSVLCYVHADIQTDGRRGGDAGMQG